MKKTRKILVTSIGILAFGTILLLPNNITAFSSVAPEKRTGSPGDGQNCSGCHSGSAVVNLSEGITTDIPIEGYTPGETYTITVGGAITRPSKTRYGFQLSPQNASGDLLGTLTAGSGSTLLGSGKYVGHNGAVTTSNPSWSFSWTAPAENTGEVGFYLSVVAANGNGGTSGDEVLIYNTLINENNSVSSSSVEGSAFSISNFNDRIVLNAEQINEVLLIDLNGKIMYQKNNASQDNLEIITSNLSSGIYVVKANIEGVWKSQKIIVY